jgi:hypothetical protein
MTDIYLSMSLIAQVLFAISAIPFWWSYRKSTHVFGLFEWTWYVAEVLMIAGSIGLERWDLLPGLVVNYYFLTLCLWKSTTNWIGRRNKIDLDAMAAELRKSGIDARVYRPGDDLSKLFPKKPRLKIAKDPDEETH